MDEKEDEMIKAQYKTEAELEKLEMMKGMKGRSLQRNTAWVKVVTSSRKDLWTSTPLTYQKM